MSINRNKNEVRAIENDVVFGDDGSPIIVGSLPPNSIITAIKVLVNTAFNSSGTDLLIVGNATDDNRYADAVNLSSIGPATVNQLNVGIVESASESTEILAQYDQSVADATTGSCLVIMEYLQIGG